MTLNAEKSNTDRSSAEESREGLFFRGMRSRASVLLRAKLWPFTTECPFFSLIKSILYHGFCKVC